MNAPDLTQRPPRSPRVRLGGYTILPRLLDKARATIAGLQALKRPDEVARLRGLAPEEFVPKGLLEAYRESERGPLVVEEVK